MPLTHLKKSILQCTACINHLPLGPRPIIQINSKAKLLLIGQAPGFKVHQSGVPWDDASGKKLREWIGISQEIFYDEKKVAIVPMGFCYPGKGKQGDLPPRKECFNHWHEKILMNLPNIQLSLLIGNYAHCAYLKNTRKNTLTETVRSWEEYLPHFIPLPHPSPLNFFWQNKNKWFEKKAIPAIRSLIHSTLQFTDK